MLFLDPRRGAKTATNFDFHQGREGGKVLPCCPVEGWTRQSHELIAQTDTVRQLGQLIYCVIVKILFA